MAAGSGGLGVEDVSARLIFVCYIVHLLAS